MHRHYEPSSPHLDAYSKGRLVGMNHIAIEVGDVEAALSFYGKIFTFEVFRRVSDAAFITMGDQFLVLIESKTPHRDEHRHFGLVVDDRSSVRGLATAAGATMIKSRFSISSIPGATSFKWSSTVTSSSRRPPKCYRAWDLLISARPLARLRSSGARVWHPPRGAQL